MTKHNNNIVHEMERLRQPELNRYYLDLKYISNTHTHIHIYDVLQGLVFEFNRIG